MNKLLDGLALVIIMYMLIGIWIETYNYDAHKHTTFANIFGASGLVVIVIWAILRFKGM